MRADEEIGKGNIRGGLAGISKSALAVDPIGHRTWHHDIGGNIKHLDTPVKDIINNDIRILGPDTNFGYRNRVDRCVSFHGFVHDKARGPIVER